MDPGRTRVPDVDCPAQLASRNNAHWIPMSGCRPVSNLTRHEKRKIQLTPTARVSEMGSAMHVLGMARCQLHEFVQPGPLQT